MCCAFVLLLFFFLDVKWCLNYSNCRTAKEMKPRLLHALKHPQSSAKINARANTVLSVVVLLTSDNVPSGLMLFAYFVSAYFAVRVPCFSAFAVCNLKGSQSPNHTVRAIASHKQEPNSVTLAQPPLCTHTRARTHTYTNKPDLTWVYLEAVTALCVTVSSQAFWGLSPFSQRDATRPQDGETQTLSWSLVLTLSWRPNRAVYHRAEGVLRYWLLIRGFAPQCWGYITDLQSIQMALFSQFFTLYSVLIFQLLFFSSSCTISDTA